VTIQQDGKQMAELHDGNSFGEISLIDNTTRNADVIAKTNLVVYVLNKKMFISLIGSVEKAKGIWIQMK